MKYFLLFFIRLFSLLDFFFRRIVVFIFEKSYLYQRTGSCKQCGQCCKSIIICMEPKFLRKRFLRNFAIWWNKYFNSLYHIGTFIEDGYMVYSCKLQNEDGSCGNYRWRPLFCREYPHRFKYFEMPATLPGCGFKFEVKQKSTK